MLDKRLNALAWPTALILVFHRLVVLAWTGSVTDDFTTVQSATRRFVERVPVYNEVYHHVNPHYLYNPGATLLLAPLGLTADTGLIRPWFILLNAVAIVAALGWMTRLVNHSLSSPLFPMSIALAFITESVTNTLVFSNINGVLLFALVAYLAFLLRGHSWWAGLVIGLAIVIKPMFLPLLFLPLVKLDWKAIVAGIAVPAGLNAIAWPLVPGANDYLTKVVPYLGETRDYANSSLAGFAVYFGMPGWMEKTLWALLALMVAFAAVALVTLRDTEPLVWATTTAAVLLTGVFLLSSLGQAYYSMMLFPAMFTAVGRVSFFHTPTAWLGALLALSPLQWMSPHFPQLGKWLTYFLPTAGWAVLIVAAATWVGWTAWTNSRSFPTNNGAKSSPPPSTTSCVRQAPSHPV
ncbi:glycosyltransferase family 87 protein [Corynebacterium breve]|uniref:Glycosyltransferase family 87 protein n=1 Tax=Corynebacterium breve TaxID=3049799 RepID=A0ABY8VH48_9CORY|nr:glycosyltransferase family 87 protein [Corynebacterium breve]WIM68970.1 glycosyltransferase family 87 protein [Corynebacterium breve]